MLSAGVQEAILPYFQPIICVDSNSVFAYEVLERKSSYRGIAWVLFFRIGKYLPRKNFWLTGKFGVGP
ncbi:MAG: hypothetical protein PHC92_12115 [Syntrophomonadaceae bacterium]|nr:hypothetical protein [Syntrophomonadaceae bacterium]